MIMFTIGWIVFAIFSIMCDKKYIDLSWKMKWILHSFWHLSYFMILLVICVVWKPSEQSHQYAYSFQIPSSDAEAEA
ncbi:lung seven transmembrane receptor family protein [bacterium]|nr:lung seven transmembrane receptor family protein [bacterium]